MDKIEFKVQPGPGSNHTRTNIKLNGRFLENVTKFEIYQEVGKPTVITMEITEPEMTIDYTTYVEVEHDMELARNTSQSINWRERYREINNLGPR